MSDDDINELFNEARDALYNYGKGVVEAEVKAERERVLGLVKEHTNTDGWVDPRELTISIREGEK